MKKRYSFAVACIKESPVRWGISLESLGGPVPAEIVQFPNMTQPLTDSPFARSGFNPIDYFRRLTRGIPNMLRGYSSRMISRIKSKLDQLNVGEKFYAKIKYTDRGKGLSPYNYEIEIIDQIESVPISQNENGSGLEKIVEDLRREVDDLRSDVAEIRSHLKPQEITFDPPLQDSLHPLPSADETTEFDPDPHNISLTPSETAILEYLVDYQTASTTELKNWCRIDSVEEAMAGLIAKTEMGNMPWIDVQRSEKGEIFYAWNPPTEN